MERSHLTHPIKNNDQLLLKNNVKKNNNINRIEKGSANEDSHPQRIDMIEMVEHLPCALA